MRRAIVNRGVALFAVAGLAASAFASDSDLESGKGFVSPPKFVEGPGRLNLRTGDVDLARLPDVLRSPAPLGQGTIRHVLQLTGGITPERHAALVAAGVHVYDYLPTDCFLVDLRGADRAVLAGLDFVIRAVPYQNDWKLDRNLGVVKGSDYLRRRLTAEGKFAVVAYVFIGADMDSAARGILAIPGASIHTFDDMGDQEFMHVSVPADQAARLAEIPEIMFVEDFPEITLRNSSNRWIVQSNVTNQFPLYNNGLRGEGEILGHMDGRVSEPHCSFDDSVSVGPTHRKILAYNQSQGFDFHGTHTAATAVGDSGADNNARGVAYLAKMVHNGIPSFTESTFYSRLSTHRTQGATVHTNSWGDDGTTAYTGMCRAIDNFSWTFDEQLVAFAVTNQTLLKTPENAKACLAVGASQDSPSQGSHCSGGDGPTNDQRRKPEVYAPGCNTNSSSSATGCSTSTATGTSMACPAVCGATLLVRQYFTDGYYPTGAATPANALTPTGALLHAMMINTSVDMTGVTGYPSNREGWGRVLADNALFFPGDARKLVIHDERNNVPTGMVAGDARRFRVRVNSSAEQLRVTMTFHDAPAAVNANPARVNDLDLTVLSPSATMYRGNVFSAGSSTTGGSADQRNTTEQVHINSPAAGVWTIRVGATLVNSYNSTNNTGQQGLGVVVTGDVTKICASDYNADGVTDAFDYDDFASDFFGSNPNADHNGDGVVNAFDYDDFVNDFFNLAC